MDIPPDGYIIWEWFIQLDSRRQFNEAGAQATSYQEIEAWTKLMGWRPTPWEVETLVAMDQTRTRIWNKRTDPGEPTNLVSLKDTSGLKAMLRGLGSR